MSKNRKRAENEAARCTAQQEELEFRFLAACADRNRWKMRALRAEETIERGKVDKAIRAADMRRCVAFSGVLLAAVGSALMLAAGAPFTAGMLFLCAAACAYGGNLMC